MGREIIFPLTSTTRVVLMLLFAALPVSAAECDRICTAHLTSILESQKFTSSTDSGAKFLYLGKIREGNTCFQLYYYDHTNIHPAQIAHGLQKLIVIRSGETYVGSYLLDADDPVPTVSRKSLVFDLPVASGNEIPFGADGPPMSVRINGTNLQLGR